MLIKKFKVQNGDFQVKGRVILEKGFHFPCTGNSQIEVLLSEHLLSWKVNLNDPKLKRTKR